MHDATENYLPTAPRYYRVLLDDDRVLTFHHFGDRPLKRGDVVCVCEGIYEESFGTVLSRAFPRRSYSYRIRKAQRVSITVNVPTEKEYWVA
jgi:hypothetical protein